MKITESTTIPLFAALGSVPLIVGGIFWLTAISFKADQAVAENMKQDKVLEQLTLTLKNVENVVIRTEERLRKDGRK